MNLPACHRPLSPSHLLTSPLLPLTPLLRHSPSRCPPGHSARAPSTMLQELAAVPLRVVTLTLSGQRYQRS